MKPKKIIALLLALCMVMCMAACGGGDNASSTSSASSAGGESSLSSDAGSSEASEPESSEASTEGEPYRVRLTLPTMMTIPATEDIKFVEDTINNYIHDELGITDYEMELELASLTDYDTNVSMALASGEKYDIIIATNLNTYVTNGYMTDLTPYAENELAGALGVLPENWIRSGTVGGKIYAVPCYKGQVLSWKYIYDDAVYGDAVDWSAIKSLDDLDAAMPALKAAAPDQVPGVYNNQLVNLTAFEDHTSIVGQYAATVGDSTQLVNYFTTDAFKKGVEMAYKWSQAGYSDPEGSTNTLSHDAIIMSGQSKGVIMGHAYSIETIEQMFTMNNSYGGNFKAVEIATSDMTTNTLTYGIAYTSENPSAAAKMLSLIWTDEFVMSNLIYGVEGTSWEWNEDHSSIVYPEGLGIDTVPYTALYTCGAFGNQFNLYGMDGNTSEADKGFMKELLDGAWNPPLLGFIPNSEPVSTQVAAVSNVYDQYYKVLTYGDVNPDEFLPKFLEELETAGINDIIAEYQSQVDEWLKTI
jgi:putative aldouronate transport system substrate-binding protein